MNTAAIAITVHGLAVAGRLQEGLDCDLYVPDGIMAGASARVNVYHTSTTELIGRIWKKYDSFIFIMALGIVNRIIRNHIDNKHEDPAVVVVDEMGRYAISALSGHEGGANRLAESVALICQGDFVVTTGSEAIKTLIAGMGCRRGISTDTLEKTLEEGLKRINRKLSDVRLIASVEAKRNEEGLLGLSERLKVPLKFIPTALIKAVEDNFDKSELVNKALGIYSVAEPCAMLGGFRCHIVLPKTKIGNTTIAIAEERFLQ